jgi:hypothetical protein
LDAEVEADRGERRRSPWRGVFGFWQMRFTCLKGPIAGLYYRSKTTQNTPMIGGTTVTEDIDAELQAIKALVQTLEPLKPEVRARVIEHSFKVLGIDASPTQATPLTQPLPLVTQPRTQHLDEPTDILTLKERKNPRTANEMIAIVAYYLEHSASERQPFITQDDIQKYFVQGQYPMPGSKPQALVNAKNAGYLDAVEPGKYRLNSVGYNLVAHKMPKDGSAQSKSRRKVAKKVARKSAKKGRK